MQMHQASPTLYIKAMGMELNAVGVFAIVAGLVFLAGMLLILVPRIAL
jgi:hypothetical protein